ncbi:MAG TPA: PadR family transcriptional regulator [Nitrososphaerales archaeon]|nr:PadR family transcriptional regulator [Nitrososphaerales archaeon]
MSKKCLGPQAVPRGFLRAYVLAMLSHSRETGYSIMQSIVDKSEGSWRPGPGTIYPTLRTLAREGLVLPTKHVEKHGERSSFSYSITSKGKHELAELQNLILTQGTRKVGMMEIFGYVLPASSVVKIFHYHFRGELELLIQKIMELPRQERESAYEEIHSLIESQFAVLRSRLK